MASVVLWTIPLVIPVTLDVPLNEDPDTRPQHHPRKPWMQHPEQDGNIQASCPSWRTVQDKKWELYLPPDALVLPSELLV